MWHEIRIRQMRFLDAKSKLEKEIHKAFCDGVEYVEIIHGIGTYQLRKMSEDYVKSLDFAEVLLEESSFNPGTLKVKLSVPSQTTLKKYIL